MTNADRFLAQLEEKSGEGAFLTEGEAEARVAGHALPLGKMRTQMAPARVANLDEVKSAVVAAQADEELVVKIELEAMGERTLKMILVHE